MEKRSLYARLVCNSQGLQGVWSPRANRILESADSWFSGRRSKVQRNGIEGSYVINWGDPDDMTDMEYAILNALHRGLAIFETEPRLTTQEIEEAPDGINPKEFRLFALQTEANKTRKSICELWVLKRLGLAYRDLATEIVHDALIVWIEHQGLTHPVLCLKRTLMNRLKREGLTQKIFTPLTIENSLNLGRKSSGLSIKDLPDNLQTIASLKLAGFTMTEMQEKLRKSPRDICEDLRQIGEFLNINTRRKKQVSRIELEVEIAAGDGKQTYAPKTRRPRQVNRVAYHEEIQREEKRRRENWNNLHGPQLIEHRGTWKRIG